MSADGCLPPLPAGGFTVEYTRRVYRGERLTRNERYRVSYGAAPGPAGGR